MCVCVCVRVCVCVCMCVRVYVCVQPTINASSRDLDHQHPREDRPPVEGISLTVRQRDRGFGGVHGVDRGGGGGGGRSGGGAVAGCREVTRSQLQSRAQTAETTHLRCGCSWGDGL
jgi:uncharacterized membrane protein YgcG